MTERERLIKQAEETFGVKAVLHGEKPSLSPLEQQLAEALIEQSKETRHQSRRKKQLQDQVLGYDSWQDYLRPESRAALTAAGYLNEGENE